MFLLENQIASPNAPIASPPIIKGELELEFSSEFELEFLLVFFEFEELEFVVFVFTFFVFFEFEVEFFEFVEFVFTFFVFPLLNSLNLHSHFRFVELQEHS